ncbi:MAG: GNAT family N-acetyltransferase [Gammaproteobacteria bacterium]|nr:GNAT family N-acetyltransferase [Gammaproteobacteria bacterium]
MRYTYKSPHSDQEWHDYFQLRWQILRAPWQQASGSERDEFENSAFHIAALDARHITVGVGRIHQLTGAQAQIRYMAVHTEHRGYGIGGEILSRLEQQAQLWSCSEILLNARVEFLEFYLKHDYLIIGEAPTLFGSIEHKRMHKLLAR